MVLGFYYYYYYFKIHFPFLSSPACLHNPPGGPSTKRQHRWVTWRSPRFYPRYEPSLKSLTESFKNGHGLHSSERRMDCNLCHKQNTTVVIPNGEKIDPWNICTSLSCKTLMVQAALLLLSLLALCWGWSGYLSLRILCLHNVKQIPWYTYEVLLRMFLYSKHEPHELLGLSKLSWGEKNVSLLFW